ncbi:hypothetical protein LC613_07350 [Nostoc sphaeroides CHAB 2801]|uniref:hypothetical protein n=1 Tax=Nostoc sphaeroides TaxID=446679 RepID=UPI001E4EA730|nr:hypothetical protein [Nostoc sphaeroides]MCC5627960.1 hypothetical protein [Nostoc sphaeroides CHAB 2801]
MVEGIKSGKADRDRLDLQNPQQILGLRNEDTMPIEALVTARFKTHQQNLQAYQQEFTTALRQEFPLSMASCDIAYGKPSSN